MSNHWDHPGWKEAARRYHEERLRGPQQPPPKLPRPNPGSQCEICGLKPCLTEGFCHACREADAERQRNPQHAELPRYWASMDLGALYEALNNPHRFAADAPQSIYDSVVWSLIYNKQPTAAVRAANRDRLAQFSHRQLQDLIAALKRKNCDPALIAEIESNL